jgi:hypothetical protein
MALNHNETIALLPKSKKELAVEFEVSRDTIRTWCQAIGINTNKKILIPELKKFYTHYGIPRREYYEADSL